MARRGAALLDIKSTEDLVQHLKLPGLHVLNVYSGFFGPCRALATNLRDFKMVEGGDDLQVVTVNVDEIDCFKRFRNKSQPTFLFIVDGRSVNCYWGCNTAYLLNLIREELKMYKSGETANRKGSDLRDMSVPEAQRFRATREELITNRKKEQAKKAQIVHDYRMKVTNDIMDNATDIGVTIFMPHVIEKDLVPNLVEPGSKMQMQMKHNITTKITREDLEMINFDAQNLSPILFNHIVDKELLIVAWKMNSTELRPINEVFSEFTKMLREEAAFEQMTTKKGKKKDAKKTKKKAKEEPVAPPPLEEGEEPEAPPFKLPLLAVPLAGLKKEKKTPIQIEPIDLQFIESDSDIIKLLSESIKSFTEQSIIDMYNSCIEDALVEIIDQNKREKKKSAAKSTTRGEILMNPKEKDTAYVCPVWSPPSPRSHASILFLYFRRLLSYFLPMDPPGASRYVIVVFNIEKLDEILDFMGEHTAYRQDILANGIFRGFGGGEDYQNTTLLVKTGVEYRLLANKEPDDKLILKVSSNTEALLALVDLEPEFISQNEHDARLECDVIFPLGYSSISEEEAQAELEMNEIFDTKVEGEEGAEGAEGVEGTEQIATAAVAPETSEAKPADEPQPT